MLLGMKLIPRETSSTFARNEIDAERENTGSFGSHVPVIKRESHRSFLNSMETLSDAR